MNARSLVAIAIGPALAVCVACSSFRGGNAAPHIDAVQPDSVLLLPGAVVEVVIRGHGFAPGKPGQNIVRFGDVKIGDVPASSDGKEIRLVIPDRAASRGEAAPLPLEAGRYGITVETSAGISNSIGVRVDR